MLSFFIYKIEILTKFHIIYPDFILHNIFLHVIIIKQFYFFIKGNIS